MAERVNHKKYYDLWELDPIKLKFLRKDRKIKSGCHPPQKSCTPCIQACYPTSSFFLLHFCHQGASNCTKLNSAQLSGDMLMRKGTFLYKCPLSHIYNILQKISKAYKSTKRERKGNIFSNPTWKEKIPKIGTQ